MEIETRARLGIGHPKHPDNVRILARPRGDNRAEWQEVARGTNKIPDVFLHFLGEFLENNSDAEYNTGLTYYAIGTGTTPPAASDTQLATETGRKTFTEINYNSATFELTITTFFAAADCTYDIQEVGIFGGASATATANTGKLADRALVSFDNSLGSYDLTFESIIELSEVV
ncbi:MAG: hypothetical protein FJZ95_02835 [Chloroflexi bacterium]|nr:hypothetical protein [Chloroflexota bacterium]